MEKKSSINDVHKVIQKDLVELYKTLSNKLGSANPFAKFSIGGGFYLWADSRCQWKPMIGASSLEQSLVRAALLDTKERVAQKLGAKAAEQLFTVPDDSYIYYSNDGAEIEILVTGWGFKKPVRVTGKKDVDDINVKNPVNISFLYDGRILENYEFGIKLPTQIKHQTTNAEGIYSFDDLKVNEKVTFVDFTTNQEFLLVVLEGQSQYSYDVTKRSRVDIIARLDASPLAGETVRLSYRGALYDLATGPDGSVSIELPYYEGEIVTASMRDQAQNEVVSHPCNEITFNFVTPKEIVETDIEVSVSIDGAPVEGKDVTINYANNTYTGKTDWNGTLIVRVQIEEGETCVVSVPEFESQSRQLGVSTNQFKFEKESEKKPSVFFSPHILIEGDKGFIGSRYPITVTYDGQETEYVSDDSGIVYLPEMEEGKFMQVKDVLNPDNVCEYELDSNQLEYIFHVPYEPQSTDRDIKVTVLDVEGNPMKCDHVRFQQESTNTELLAGLDGVGSTYFGKDTFASDAEIKVTIIGGKKNYDQIVFSLEEGETEYVLQEGNWNTPVILQILAALAAIVGSILIWPVIKGLIMGVYHLIYN